MNARERDETFVALTAVMRMVRGCHRRDLAETIGAAKPENLVTMASAHKLLPSIAPAFEIASLKSISDPELVEFFGYMRQRNIERNLILLEQLSKLALCFVKLGLGPPVVLKGAAFLVEAQHNPPDRFMIDIDLLVAPNDLGCAMKAMVELGYSSNMDGEFDPQFDLHYPAFVHPDYDGSVEIHFRLSQTNNLDWFDWQTLVSRSSSVALAEGTILLPDNEWRLMHLAYHNQVNSHYYNRRIVSLRDCLDYYDLAVRPDIDFASLRDEFDKIGAQREFEGITAFTQSIFDGLLPHEIVTTSGGRAWMAQSRAAIIRKHDIALWTFADWLRIAGKRLLNVEAWRAAIRLVRNKKTLQNRINAWRRQLKNRFGPDD